MATTILADRRVSRSADWARKVSSFSLVLLIVACVGHRYAMVETAAFLWVLALVATLSITGLMLAALGFHRLWHFGAKGGRASLAALLVSALVLAPYGYGLYLYLTHPPLADISTDLADPPAFITAQHSRTADMNLLGRITREEAAVQAEAYPDLTGRRFEASMERVLSALKVALAKEGWRTTRPLPVDTDQTRLSLEVYAPTWLLRLPSDGVLRVVNEGETVFVDLRIAQRYFWHDLGSGARRINRFMTALEAEFERQSLEIIDIPASAGEEDPAN